MKKILVCFLTLVMSFCLVAYGGATLHAQTVSKVNNSESEIPIELVFYNDSTYNNNLILMWDRIFVERGFVGGSGAVIDLKAEALKPGSYILTFDMADLNSDKYLYEMGGNIYDKQNGISLPTKWIEQDNIITAEFTITNTTNRLSLGEGGMYIEINEPSLDHRLVMSITLEKKVTEIPIELVFYNDSTYNNNLILMWDRIFVERGFVGGSGAVIDLKAEALKPGSYILTFDMADLNSDKYLYEMGGNIYDKQNGISLPTKWIEQDNIITAEFTITNTTNRLSLGEGGMYIEINEPSLDHRLVMSITLEKR